MASSASSQVFGIPELAEHILSYLDLNGVLVMDNTNQLTRDSTPARQSWFAS